MNPAETKVQRLLQIEALLLDHPEGLTQSDIARRLSVNRSTIHRYLPDLTQHAPIFEEDGRIFIDRKSYLVNLKLNLYEALSLHLATRLLTYRIERHNPHAASLLRKLSKTIEKLSPQISKHLSISADVTDDPSRFQDPHFMSVLETLALAWAEGRVVNVWHRHTKTNKIHQYQFSVYFIEPYAVGLAVHVIGLRNPPDEIRTFNLARIERIELTSDVYQIPDSFDPTQLLQQAWGIWYTDRFPELVTLKFSPRVADRVLETRWHPSQQTHVEVDGSLIWKASVAEPKEMIPWIRGWGADCEVVSPVDLRNKMINEVTSLGRMYIQSKRDSVMELWAKYEKGDETNWHPLIFHLLDTAAVVQLLWDDCLSESYKTSIASAFGSPIDEMSKVLAFWVGLHDIGKASPEFQKKNHSRQRALEELSFEFPSSKTKVDGFHATGTTLILKRILLEEEQSLSRKFKIDLANTLGGHHGEFPDNLILNQYATEKFHVGDQKWQDVQNKIYSDLSAFFDNPVPKACPEDNSLTNPIFMLIAGLTTAADWIASNENYFPFFNADVPLNEYFSIAKKQAKSALKNLGWYGWKSSGDIASFEKLFPEFSPNKIQQAVIDLCPNLDSPFLAIIEAPTGSGKTEAALYLADAIVQRDQKGGIYIAMPTQATSNQMYSRTAKFLSKRYSDDEINLHLVHGAALLINQRQNFQPTNVMGEDGSDYANIHAHGWFLPRKKTLLAPFGVGTVDQTFLSVLKSRHFFLRLFGLSHKVLIFDEVHAYDVYMTEIFKTLLHWLRAVGTSVIILSATLPSSTRSELMKAFGASTPTFEEMNFPRISTVSGGQSQVIQAGTFPSRQIDLQWINKEPASINKVLKEKLSNGGCAAVICNRVNRAQEIYESIKDDFNDDMTEIILFHSRFPYCWRKDIEEKVLAKFGKETGNRPYRAIVIATQVIEQSLDLDFDLLITDLAPIDLLIQRIGRLHRHQNIKSPPTRPPGLEEPLCFVSSPDLSISIPDINFGPDAFVYEPYILYRSSLVLAGRKAIHLPKETDKLIEFVYTLEKVPSFSEKMWEDLGKMRKEMMKHHAESQKNAENYLIPSTTTSFLGTLKSFLSDDVQGLSKRILKAPTREITPSIQIVCLENVDGGLYIMNSNHLIDLEGSLTQQQVRLCLQASATLNHLRIINFFLYNFGAPPESFKQSAPLRWHFPVIFTKKKFITEDFTLVVDREIGIQMIFNK